MKQVAFITMILLTGCTINHAPCPHHKNVPKEHQCDQFLLS